MQLATCDFVSDGDTIRVKNDVWIRLANVRAPEKHQTNWAAAKRLLESYVLNRVIYVKSVATDHFNRVVADIYVNGVHVNAAMRIAGYTNLGR